MNRKKILLIEDSRDSRNLTLEALAIFPELKIIVKESGEEALDYIQEKPNIDLFLIDIGLPKMNGIEFVKQLNLNFPKYRPIPKISITAHVTVSEMDSYIGKGLKKIVTKPIKINILREIIKSELNLEVLEEHR